MAWRSCLCGTRLPGRAFVAGTDESGRPLHVARGLHGHLLLPGPLDRGKRTLMACDQERVHVLKDWFDVLVAEEPLCLRWQHVAKGETLPQGALVVARNRGRTEHLGRVSVEGTHFVGRVVEGVCMVALKVRVERFEDFEVLVLEVNL